MSYKFSLNRYHKKIFDFIYNSFRFRKIYIFGTRTDKISSLGTRTNYILPVRVQYVRIGQKNVRPDSNNDHLTTNLNSNNLYNSKIISNSEIDHATQLNYLESKNILKTNLILFVTMIYAYIITMIYYEWRFYFY